VTKNFPSIRNYIKQKWGKYGTILTTLRTGLKKRQSGNWLKRPLATLKELQEVLTSTCWVLRVTTNSHIISISGLWDRGARWKSVLIEKKIVRGICKVYLVQEQDYFFSSAGIGVLVKSQDLGIFGFVFVFQFPLTKPSGI
uniref:Uncharacterized protein n=1 Tax=Kryptolebias marmoratus TaxID=37003 RepID=A0A3Q3A163_KRYMA